jgi:hypothetical protein
MATLPIELPPHRTQTSFNLRRWAELVADPLKKSGLCPRFPKHVKLPWR